MDNRHFVGIVNDKISGPALELLDGSLFYFLYPEQNPLRIETIAAALSRQCRFNGHCRDYYSVAQHCVLVSQIVPKGLALQGLMHDASEAFIGDMSRPFKALLDLQVPDVIDTVENRIHQALAVKFGFGYPFDKSIKHADNVVLATEQRDLMAKNSAAWEGLPDPLPPKIIPWSPEVAHREFMERFGELHRRNNEKGSNGVCCHDGDAGLPACVVGGCIR